jgi:endo-1,4-beta-xylanase
MLTRRSALVNAAANGLAAVGLGGRPLSGSAAQATPTAREATPVGLDLSRAPLWRTAADRGLVFGTSTATWQLEDAEYARLVDHEAAILFTEDDLLWYRLRPEPGAELDFTYGDRFFAFAEERGQLVFATHLVWDEGFGEGWTEDDLFGMEDARSLMLDTVEQVVGHYRGRVAGWVVVNEAIDAHEADGLRRDYPWYQTVGPDYVAEAFRAARAADPDALLVLNEFGFETDDEYDAAADKQVKALVVLDALLADGVPVDAFGVQAHLEAAGFAEKFDAAGYQAFLAELADRGMTILVTELDVLDDGVPEDIPTRDEAIADAYRTYLDVALAEPAVAAVMTFGLSDRYTWLQEDYPREDGVARRPLPYDEELRPKPAYDALAGALGGAGTQSPLAGAAGGVIGGGQGDFCESRSINRPPPPVILGEAEGSLSDSTNGGRNDAATAGPPRLLLGDPRRSRGEILHSVRDDGEPVGTNANRMVRAPSETTRSHASRAGKLPRHGRVLGRAEEVTQVA